VGTAGLGESWWAPRIPSPSGPRHGPPALPRRLQTHTQNVITRTRLGRRAAQTRLAHGVSPVPPFPAQPARPQGRRCRADAGRAGRRRTDGRGRGQLNPSGPRDANRSLWRVFNFLRHRGAAPRLRLLYTEPLKTLGSNSDVFCRRGEIIECFQSALYGRESSIFAARRILHSRSLVLQHPPRFSFPRR